MRWPEEMVSGCSRIYMILKELTMRCARSSGKRYTGQW